MISSVHCTNNPNPTTTTTTTTTTPAAQCVVNNNPSTGTTTGSSSSTKTPITALSGEEDQANEVTTKPKTKSMKKSKNKIVEVVHSSTTTTVKKNKTKKAATTIASTRKSSSSSSSSTTTTASLSTTQSVFVRRIQSEWKDAVKMGVAYNWVERKPIRSKKKKKQNKKQQQNKLAEEKGDTESDNLDVDVVDDDKAPDQQQRQQQQQQHQQYFCLGPLGSNLFVWHFSFLGMENSTYDGGIYHGRLILPPQYPSAPPRVQVWTPSGRFKPGADICLSASAFHPETWNPAAYNLRTIIESLRLHVLTPPTEIGGATATPKKRKLLARQSRSWTQTVRVPSSKKGPTIAEIDHSLMIQQGIFPPAAAIDDTETQGASGADANANANATNHDSIEEAAAFGLNDVATRHVEEQQQKEPKKVKSKKQKKKKKKKRKTLQPSTKQAVTENEPTGLIALTVKTMLNSRSLRMMLIAVIIYMVLFGN